ncbi:lantibiotic dehydratase [Bacillus subtilis]|uniref:lantibiotic dehydratase n=1 Tax=Bacillus subtilis TaxID=1423 RepID=UPI001C21E868|nr:lantibiotic dehydratase [Bacillus subtilis]MBU8572317.1 lantibiotic dehydratase [Bacillus subtilis]MBU8625140.1 lantibiotic dehydratase [Bacillus subtilis]MCY9208621.1 lantibiotic dehydratase [Bacillus subtilis]MEC1581077.1 lantibiotic dehydratase [Bacillus subtilis]MED1809520.1 lantibiotic dehydratase [Bacillus subtilis]
MKSLYTPTDYYMIRVPLVHQALKNVNSQDTDQLLHDLCNDSLFREQILVSSRTLYDTMNIFLQTPDKLKGKKKRNFQQAILKYATRRATRTTPFGLFSSVGIGAFSDKNQLSFNQHSFYKKARVDFEWLYQLMRKLENEYIDRLSFTLNPACYIKGDRAYLLYSTDGKSEEVSVRATSVFHLINELCGECVAYHDIIRSLTENYENTPISKINQYVADLIDKEFLISNLRPPMTVSDQFQYLIAQAESSRIPNELLQACRKIQYQIDEYNRITIGEGEDQYLNLIETMNELIKTSSPLQVDTGLGDSSIQLDNETSLAISELASMFTYMAAPSAERLDHLEKYKNVFLERYGYEREVPLLEMLCSSSGVGAPATYTNPANEFFEEISFEDQFSPEMKQFFMKKYFESVRKKAPIQLHDETFHRICNYEIADEEIPVSFELNFFVKLRNGRVMLYLGPNVGSTRAGKTFGRFTHLSDSINAVIKNIHNKEKELSDKNKKICELSIVPNQVRSGNVTRNVSYREKEMNLFTNSVLHHNDSVKAEDVLIGIDKNHIFYARHKRTGEILSFESNHMFNPLLMPNALRFLLEISRDGKRKWNDFPWIGIYSDFKYIPEIKYKEIILSCEQWLIHKSDLSIHSNSSIDEVKSAFFEFHRTYDLPQIFYIVNADNRLLIDIEDDRTLDVFFWELKKTNHNHPLQLVAAELDADALKDRNQNVYSGEIVVPLIRKKPEKPLKLPVLNSVEENGSERIKMPFEDWLFIKLYCKQTREEELIAFEIADFYNQISDQYPVRHFFMRYRDPKPHIRLRFNGKAEVLYTLFPQLLNWLKSLREKGLVTEFVITQYEREIERYGRLDLMDAAEQVFCEDSKVVETMIRMHRMKDIAISKEIAGMVSVIQFLEQFELTFEEQLTFLEKNCLQNEYRTEFKKDREMYIEICNSDRDWDNLRKTSDGRILYEILKTRKIAAANYACLINKAFDNKEAVYSRIGSVIHLHCNRLFGTDREMENKILTLCRHSLYAQRYQKKNGSLAWK